ncbi:hypothetical protein M413DRAFT_45603, partial [Hebeloma cylindrosporum]
ETLFSANELARQPDRKELLAGKLDKLADCLKLSTFDGQGNYKEKLLPISHSRIEPAYVICPPSFVCETQTCNPRSLRQSTKDRDIPLVTLIKGQRAYQNVPVLTGKCPNCKTLYAADHERYEDTSTVENTMKRVYINSAKYLKIGQRIWSDRGFAIAVINAMYNFHASASAYSEYWNNTYGTKETSITRAHAWQACVQQSVRTIAEESGIDAEFDDGLNIKEVTTQAFSLLGEDGIIRASEEHACDECTQKRKDTSDAVFNNPAAVVGVDATDDNIPALPGAPEEVEVDAPQVTSDHEMDTDDIPNIKMVVLDGIVMGPQHCAYDNCTNDLSNSRGGSLCDIHHVMLGAQCLVRDCNNRRVERTLACQQHQSQWRKHTKNSKRHNQAGVRRMLQRPGENNPWEPVRRGPNPQQHDDPNAEPRPPPNYFRAARFYCVETICAPCGVVIAWTKFAKSESPTNILNFL